MPNLYVLLVGVSHYPNLPTGRQLRGPINDVHKLEKYFLQPEHLNNFQHVHLHKLCSPASEGEELPNKTNIVKGFTEFICKVQTGDTVVFYYSGHGVREHSDISSFQREEIDGCIGSITAYDIQIAHPLMPQGEAALSDKEMRYLIRQLAENSDGTPRAHVLTIFDCCHSGHHTRAPEDMPETAFMRQVVRQAIPARTHDTFLFADDPQIWGQIISDAPLSKTLPLGNHVMLAACREVELAWERLVKDGQFGGVFTAALLEVLQAHRNQISYHDLHARVLNRMRFYYTSSADRYDVRQTPQLFIQAPSSTARYHTFLTDTANERPITFPLDYMEREQQWRLAAGAFHGLQPDQQTYPQSVQVWDIQNPALHWPAQIASVYPTHAVLSWPQETPLAQGTYQAKVEGLNLVPLHIFLQGETDGVTLLREQLVQLANQADVHYFKEVFSIDQADYVLYAQQGLWFTFLAVDLRPLLMPIRYRQVAQLLPEKALIAYADLKQMAHWHFLKNLNANAGNTSAEPNPDYPIEMRVYKETGENSEIQIFPHHGQFLIDLSCTEPVWNLRFELENHSKDILFCNLAYLSYNFGFNNTVIMLQSVMGLSSGETMKSPPDGDNKYIAIKVDPYITQFHWSGENNFLKLTYSKVPLNMDGFELEGLPTPSGQVRTRSEEGLRSVPKPPVDLPYPDWSIRTYGFYIVNPHIDFGIAQHLASTLPHYTQLDQETPKPD